MFFHEIQQAFSRFFVAVVGTNPLARRVVSGNLAAIENILQAFPEVAQAIKKFYDDNNGGMGGVRYEGDDKREALSWL